MHSIPLVKEFVAKPTLDRRPLVLSYPEFEALRLVDGEDLSHEDAAARMGTSRGTVWRLVKSARTKIVSALIEGRPLLIAEEGEVEEVEG